MALGIIVTIVVCTLLSAGIWYLAIPALTLASCGLAWMLFGVSLVFSLGFLVLKFITDDWGKTTGVLWAITGGVLLFIIVVSLIGSPIFNYLPYRDAIVVSEYDFDQDFENVSNGDASLLDLDTARRLGDRVLGNVPNAPWYEVSGEYNLIVYNKKQYRISPLEYRDFTTYFKASGVGIPGYVLVSVDEMEAEFVQTNPIKYSPSGMFGQNLRRHLRSQFPSVVFDASFMEVDDQGTPYWVTATLEAHAGLWGAHIANGFVLTNACTGESQWYRLIDKPEWVDHVFSLGYLMERVDWHYNYVRGWWNISHTDVLRTTYSYRSGYNKET